MRSDRLLLGAALALGLGASGLASAYSLIGWDWAWQSDPMSDPFYINPGSFPSSVGSFSEVRNALRDGLQRWGDEGQSNFSFNYGGTTNQNSFTTDGVFIAQWSNQYASGGTLAVAQSFGSWGDMTECDIRFYAGNGGGAIPWSSDPGGASWFEIDLEQTATHEFGHCAGLDHSGNSNAIMYGAADYGAGPAERSLHPDDIAGLQAMYGVATGGSLDLVPTTAFVAGSPLTLSVSGGSPGDTFGLALSTVGEGSGPCFSGLGGLCLDILPPITQVGTFSANSAGEGSITLNIPSTAAGLDVAFQVVSLNGSGSIASNPVSATIQAAGSAGCPAGEIPDCTGACWPDTWVGDGYCDDGTLYNWGDPDFDCATYSFDAGDCP